MLPCGDCEMHNFKKSNSTRELLAKGRFRMFYVAIGAAVMNNFRQIQGYPAKQHMRETSPNEG